MKPINANDYIYLSDFLNISYNLWPYIWWCHVPVNDDADRNVTSNPEMVELSSNLLELFLSNFKQFTNRVKEALRPCWIMLPLCQLKQSKRCRHLKGFGPVLYPSDATLTATVGVRSSSPSISGPPHRVTT